MPASFLSLATVAEKQSMVMNTPSASLFVPSLLLAVSLVFATVDTQLQATRVVIDASGAPETNTSLQYHLCGPGTSDLASDTTLQLSGGVHHLQEGPFCLLQDLENFRIQGQQTLPKTVIHCQSKRMTRRGIAFFNISRLHLSHLEIINCGREIPSGLPGHVNNTFTYLGPQQKAVVIITHSTDVAIESVIIDRCVGFGVLFINPLGQTVIREVLVTNTDSQVLSECTEPTQRSDLLCSGSGIVLVFNDTVLVFNDTDTTEKLVNSTDNYTASLSIIGCSFVNNTNVVPADRFIALSNIVGFAITTERILLTGSPSLAVYLGQRHYFVDIKITNTTILSNTGNVANFILMHYNTIRTSTMLLDGLMIRNNSVTGLWSRGGGLFIIGLLFWDSLSSLTQQSKEDIQDLVEIHRSEFSGNVADYGGGVMFFMTPQNVSGVRMIVRDTVFTSNIAIQGAALYVFQFYSLTDNRAVYIYLEDITALGNTFPGADVSENSPENGGIFIVDHSANITLVGTEGKGCLFHSNRMSVFTAISTNVVLRGHIMFEGNHGFRGGALSLVDSSFLFIHNGSAICFKNNTAFREGGAMYINILGSSIGEICAIQFFAEKRVRIIHEEVQLLNISIIFSNNKALIAGNSIFGNPLYFCQFIPNTLIQHVSNILAVNEIVLYEEVFHFKETVGNGLSELISVQERICICQNATFSSKDCALDHLVDGVVVPGDSMDMFLNPVDIVGTPVASLLYSFPRGANSSDPVELDSNQGIRHLPGTNRCSQVKFTVFAPENITLYIDLSATIGKQKATIQLKTAFCPHGFVLARSDNSERLSCLCSKFIETRLASTCNLTDYTIARPTNYWVGTRTLASGSKITQFVSTCPIDYCRKDVAYVDLRVPDQLCVEGRTGTLCGACREGLSSVFGTAECRECSNAWLATLPLFVLVGAFLVIFGLLLDLTITHGLISGLFFYSNVVMVNANIFFPRNKSGFLWWLLSWVNMDSGFPLCFYSGMTEMAKLGLQYVFPAYIILMIVLIVALSQRSLLVQRLLSQLDGIHMLVTMLYVSFLKLFRTVIDTFTFVSIVSENSKEEDVVWFFDGTLQASDPVSVFLIILGSLTMAGFILPYVVFFSFSTPIQRRVSSARLNAYVDASLAPYKDEMRFWFGARLILTSVIYIIIANRGTNNPAFSLTLELGLLVGFAFIQAYIHPFKSLGVALLDMSFFLNLIALTLGTSYTIEKEERSPDQETLVNLSLSIAFLTNIGIYIWHLLKRLRKNKRMRSETDRMLATATRFLLALKLGEWRELVNLASKKRECDSEGGEVGVTQHGQYSNVQHSGGSAAPTGRTTTTIISLQECVDSSLPHLN